MEHPSFKALFQGAARLGMMAATRGLDWKTLTPFVESFAMELDGYQELSLTPGGRDLGLMTRGESEGYTHRVARYMEMRGVSEARLRRFLVSARHFEHRNLFFKVERTPESEEMSWYFRRRPALGVALEWLAADGVSPDALTRTTAAAVALEKRTVHFVGGGEPDGRSKLYFSQPTSSGWRGVLAASEALGVDRSLWVPLLAHRSTLEHKTCFLSLDYIDGQLQPGLKLDIHGVSPALAQALAGRALPDGDALLGLFERTAYDYIGVRLHADAPPTVKVYCYRQQAL